MKMKFGFKKSNKKSIENILKQYQHIGENREVRKVMKTLGEECVDSLKAKGPYDTGEYSESWEVEVEADREKVAANIYNSAHPEVKERTGSNLSTLLTYGHGTGSGGYVRGNSFISDSVDSVDTTKIGGVIANVK